MEWYTIDWRKISDDLINKELKYIRGAQKEFRGIRYVRDPDGRIYAVRNGAQALKLTVVGGKWIYVHSIKLERNVEVDRQLNEVKKTRRIDPEYDEIAPTYGLWQALIRTQPTPWQRALAALTLVSAYLETKRLQAFALARP